MSYLLDANVLLRWLETSDPRHTRVKAAIAALENQGHTLHITPQNVIEFWAVASRPTADNGFGWDLPRCDAAVPLLLASFEFLPDTPAIFDEWWRLVKVCGVSGVQVHDTRLVAVIKTHGLDGILTFNTRHFRRFEIGEGIAVIDPATVK